MLSNRRLCYWHSKSDAIIWFSILHEIFLLSNFYDTSFPTLSSFDWKLKKISSPTSVVFSSLEKLFFWRTWDDVCETILRILQAIRTAHRNHTLEQVTRKLLSIIIIWVNIPEISAVPYDHHWLFVNLLQRSFYLLANRYIAALFVDTINAHLKTISTHYGQYLLQIECVLLHGATPIMLKQSLVPFKRHSRDFYQMSPVNKNSRQIPETQTQTVTIVNKL